jgi:hypothetical protein
MEEIFSKLRSEAEDAAGALQLLERRLAQDVEKVSTVEAGYWQSLLSLIVSEATALLAEIERRFDAAAIEVIRPTASLDHARFQNIVPTTDLDHIASAARILESRRTVVIFVTLDSKIHAVRQQISDIEPSLIVTTPPYLRRQIQSARK